MLKSRKRQSSRGPDPSRRVQGALEEDDYKPRRKVTKTSGLINRLLLRETIGQIQDGYRSVPSRFQFSFEDVFSRVSGRVADDAISLGWSRDGRRILSYKVDSSTGLFSFWAFDFFGLAHSSYHVREDGGGIVYSNLPLPLVPSLISPLFPLLGSEEEDSHTFDDEDKRNTRITFWEAPDGQCIVAIATKRSVLKEGTVEFHYSIIPTPGPRGRLSAATSVNMNRCSLHFSYTVSAPFPRPSIACFAQLSVAAAQNPDEYCSYSPSTSVYRLVLNTGNSVRVLTFSVTNVDDNENTVASLDENDKSVDNVIKSSDSGISTTKSQQDSKKKPWFSRACECVCSVAIPQSTFASEDFILHVVKEKQPLKSIPCSCACSCNEVQDTSALSCSSSVATRALVESLSPLYTTPSVSSLGYCKQTSSVKLLSLSSCSLSTLLPRCVRGSVKNFDARIVQIVDTVFGDEEASKAAATFQKSKESIFIDEDGGGRENLESAIAPPHLLPTSRGVSDLSLFQQAFQLRDARQLLITAIVDHIIEGPVINEEVGKSGEAQNDTNLNSSFGTYSSSSSSSILEGGKNSASTTISPDGGTQPSSPDVQLAPPPPPPLNPPQVTSFLGPLILGTYANRKQLSRSASLSSATHVGADAPDASSLAFDEIVCADEPNQAPLPELSPELCSPLESSSSPQVASSDAHSASWRRKSVWARGVGSSYAVALPSKQIAIPIPMAQPIIQPTSVKVVDEFAFNEDERSPPDNLQRKVSDSVDSFGSSKRVVVVREAAPTRSKITVLLDVLTGNARVLSLVRVSPSLQPGFDNDSTSVISSITADLVTKQRLQMFVPPHPSADPVELNNNALLIGKSLSRLVNPRLPIALINREM